MHIQVRLRVCLYVCVCARVRSTFGGRRGKGVINIGSTHNVPGCAIYFDFIASR